MALTSAFYTGLSGLDTNSRNLDVIGNNIANVNTNAFKTSSAVFSSQFSSSLNLGSPPSAASGGTNPLQIGLGSKFAGIQKNFNNGAIQTTGINTNLALEGSGFFIIDQEGVRSFSRSGAFTLNRDNELVDLAGGRVQGYGVDAGFNIIPNVVQDVTIPLGTLTVAEATRQVEFAGNLNASGPLPTSGSIHQSRTFYTALTGGAGSPPLAGTEIDGSSEDLTLVGTNLYIDDGAGGSFLAIEGGTNTIMTVEGIEKNGKDMGSRTFAFVADQATADSLGVDAWGTTMNDFATFVDEVLGLDSTSILGNDLGGGAAIVNGQLVITGNEGTAQDLDMETADFLASNLVNGVGQPFVMTDIQEADGESVRTGFLVYDSLGTPLTVDLTFTKQAVTPGGGTTWEFVAESADTDSNDRVVGLGLVEFDSNGNFVNATNNSFSLTRDNGAVTPLTISMQFSSDTESISGLADTNSTLTAVAQDGFPIGTLNEFSIGTDGIVTGTFTNGLTRTLAQVALATFGNDQGLIDLGGGRYATGPASGDPRIHAPGAFGSATIIGGALELSNVDLATEFVNLITASTGFSAASRVITTTDELIQQLLAISR